MRGRIGVLLVALLLLGGWAAALASARGEVFTVTYSGAGTLTSQVQSQTSPECGEVTEVRNETTHFSWVTHYELPVLLFGRSGLAANSAQAHPQPSALASNESKVTLSDTGCQTAIANCAGQSDPQPGVDATIDLSSAPSRGRTRVQVQAVGGTVGFTGRSFSGNWGYSTGSCAIEFNDSKLLVPEFRVPTQLEASFPVQVKTLESIRVGHFFKVRISAGHYAPKHQSVCFAAAGCLKDSLDWHGVAQFRRVG